MLTFDVENSDLKQVMMINQNIMHIHCVTDWGGTSWLKSEYI